MVAKEVSSAAKNCPKSDAPVEKAKWEPFQATFEKNHKLFQHVKDVGRNQSAVAILEPFDDRPEVLEVTNDKHRGAVKVKSLKVKGFHRLKDVEKNQSAVAQEPFDERAAILEVANDKRRRVVEVKAPKKKISNVKSVGRNKFTVAIQEPFDERPEVLEVTKNDKRRGAVKGKSLKVKGFHRLKDVEKNQSAVAQEPFDERSVPFEVGLMNPTQAEDASEDLAHQINSTPSCFINDLVGVMIPTQAENGHDDLAHLICYINVLGWDFEWRCDGSTSQTCVSLLSESNNDDDDGMTKQSWSDVQSRESDDRDLFSI
jgi:hypothetical protein